MFTSSQCARTAATCIAVLCPLSALADTIHVAPCGDDAWSGATQICASPDGPMATIQAAIDAAEDGDEILVLDGTYTGPGNRDMDFDGKAITVRSLNGAEATTIDLLGTPDDQARAFHFQSSEGPDSVLEGFTIRNGYMDIRGGAMVCTLGSSPTVIGCVFQGNTVNGTQFMNGGGAVYIYASDPAFIDCDFVANTILVGEVFNTGGGAAYSLNGSPTFSGCTFTQNVSTGTNGGGAIAFGGNVTPSTPIFDGCVFTENSSHQGGAALNAQLATPIYTGCLFQNNAATARGGAMLTVAAGNAIVIDCEFIGNQTTSPSEGAGGAFYGLPFSTSFERCRFIDNTSADRGGAVGLANGDMSDTDATFVDCEFSANHAEGAGGAFHVEDATAVLTNCLIAQNTAAVTGGVHAEGAATVVMINTTIADNSAPAGAGAIQADGAADVAIANAIIWGNAAPQIGVGDGGVTATYSDIQGGWAGDGNVDVDPGFVDPGACAYTPTADAVVDAGDNSAVPEGVDTDICGNPRFIDYAGLGDAVVDMGAVERICLADCDANGELNVLDFVCYQGLFQAGDMAADCDNNRQLNILDFVCFQGAFQAGCP